MVTSLAIILGGGFVAYDRLGRLQTDVNDMADVIDKLASKKDVEELAA